MMRSNLIQVEENAWIVLREFPQQPKAIIHRVIDTSGDARFILMTWHADTTKRRMVGIHTSLADAEAAVPWPTNRPLHPPVNGDREAYMKAAGVNGFGYPRGSQQAREVEARVREREERSAAG